MRHPLSTLDPRKGWVGLALAFVALVSRTFSFAMMSDRERAAFVPDDGIYYLQLARNFVDFGTWTFDAGVSKTTGFHLLHAYVCALMYRVIPDATPEFAVLTQAIWGLLLTLAAYTLLAFTLARRFGGAGVWAVASVAMIGPLMHCVTSCVEWPYVVLFAAAAVWCFDRGHVTAGFAVGVLGSLSRSDFGVIALACAAFGVYTLLSRRDRRAVRTFSVGAALVAGAACGVALVFLHTHAVTGNWLQSSVRMKMLWGQSEPLEELLTLERHLGNILASNPFAFGLATTFHRSPRASFFGALVIAAMAVLLARRVPSLVPDRASRRVALVAVALITMAGYLVLYSTSPEAVQVWYTSGFTVPSAIAMAAIFEALTRVPRLALPSVALVAVLAVVNSRAAWRPLWPHQRTQWESAQYIRDQLPQGLVGAFNAGYLAFFSGRAVVNLDGLVNDDIYAHAASSTLACYVADTNLEYIVDWDVMFDNPWFERRGGYSDGALARALVPRHSLRGVANGAFDALMIYDVDLAALKRWCSPSEPPILDDDTASAQNEVSPVRQ